MKTKQLRIFFAVLTALLLITHNCLLVRAEESGIACGGIHILKTDVLGNGLSGASFQVAREATQIEMTDSAVSKRLLKIGEKMLTVVYDSFWDDRAMSDGKQEEIVTDENGTAAIYGLPYGTYYLVESKAPEGYERMEVPVRISINKYSHLTEKDSMRDDDGVVIDNTVHIITVRRPFTTLEKTSHSAVLTSAFLLLIFTAVALRICSIQCKKIH